MTVVRTVPTADLDASERAGLRRMLDDAYAGDFDDEDWDHALGGLHIMVADRGDLIAHAAVVQRRFLHADRSWRGGYVEAVAVHRSWRGQGFAAAVMTEAERVIDRAYDLGALSTSNCRPGPLRGAGMAPMAGPDRGPVPHRRDQNRGRRRQHFRTPSPRRRGADPDRPVGLRLAQRRRLVTAIAGK